MLLVLLVLLVALVTLANSQSLKANNTPQSLRGKSKISTEEKNILHVGVNHFLRSFI